MQEDNVRLKRLLDKQRRALQMPKSELGELEEEYAELLSRIESERKRLGIDDTTVNKVIADIRMEWLDDDVKWYLDHKPNAKKRIDEIEKIILKSAQNGDVADYKYHCTRLITEWSQIQKQAHQNQQLSL